MIARPDPIVLPSFEAVPQLPATAGQGWTLPPTDFGDDMSVGPMAPPEGIQVAFLGAGALPGLGGRAAAGGGYRPVRPNGAGGPPGYDIRTDMPTTTPGFSWADPSVGPGAPPLQGESPSWKDFMTGGLPLPARALVNALDSLVFNTNSSGPVIADQAGALGYDRLVKDPPFNSHGQKVFTNGRDFITPDVDQHNGGVWKGFDKRGNRTGTYDVNLDRIGK